MSAPTLRPDGLTDEDVKPKRIPSDYERGYLEGLHAFAWMRDGVYYVGTTGTTLRQAMRQFMDEAGL